MDDETRTLAASPDEDAEDRSLKDDLRQLADDARALAEAEVAYQKSRAAFAGNEAKNIAFLGVFGAVLAFFALMALVVGAVIALGPALTPWGATAAVAGTLLVIALICILLIVMRVSRMKAVLSDDRSE